MEYRQLGTSNLNVSRLCFGCWAIGGYGWGEIDDFTSIAAVRRAVELGVTFFDTADVYGFGHSETILSQALGADRHNVVIATKFGVSWNADGNTGRDSSPAYILKALEASLRRLRIDCIPLYQIHWPDPSTPLFETLEVLERCRQAGKIRYIGCSNFPEPLLREAVSAGLVVSVQMPYNMLSRDVENGYLDLCNELKLGSLAYGVLAKGLLSGAYRSAAQFDATDNRGREDNFEENKLAHHLIMIDRLREIGEKYGKSPSQTAIRWILDNPAISAALVGVIEPSHIEENVGALDWQLSVEDWAFLSDKFSG